MSTNERSRSQVAGSRKQEKRRREPDELIAEYVQEREDALDGAVAMLDRAWAVPTPEREPETVTKPSRAPQGENRASESDWGAELGSSRGGTRTPDPPVNSRLLYQLSYSGMSGGPNIVSRGGYFNRGLGAVCSGLAPRAAICGVPLRLVLVPASPPRVPAPRRHRTTAQVGPVSRRAAACP